jgi:TDG/mug DNA glycosylase family protein
MKSPPIRVWKPTREQLQAARVRRVPDLIRPGLAVLFVGINPGLYSAAIGHHFGRPGNRFWPALHQAGFSQRQLSPFEEHELLSAGYGITNVVARTTAAADEIELHEYVAGMRALVRKLKRHQPGIAAFLGLGAYRAGFARPKAQIGLQSETVGATRLWVLPSPSGLNAHYPLPHLAQLLAELRKASQAP